MKSLFSFTALALVFLSAAFPASASIVEGDWSNAQPGDTLQFSLWDVVHRERGEVVLVETDDGSLAVRIDDASPDTYGPQISRRFDMPISDSGLKISFEFMLEGVCTSRPTLLLWDVTKQSGLFLALDNNHFPRNCPGKNVINTLPDGTGEIIAPVSENQWYRVELIVSEPSEAKYSARILVGGELIADVQDLAFRIPLEDFAGISFMTNAGAGLSTFLVRNIVVTEL